MTENTIQMIAQAVIANTQLIQSLVNALPREAQAAVSEKVGIVAAPTAVAQAPAPVVQTPAPAPVVAAPQMPAPPVFTAPSATAPVAPMAQGAPFNDAQGLMQYTMQSYQTMGPTKGAQIQGVLSQMGYANINDVKPEHYVAFFNGVEALKRG